MSLNDVVFQVGADAVSWAELLGFLTGIICVYLVVVERVSNFPWGIANAAFFLILFIHAKLFADAWLQVVYIVLGFVGWWAWLKAGPNRTELWVKRASSWEIFWAVMAVAAIFEILFPILLHAKDSAPALDAFTTALSLVAQALLNFKRLQNWWFWIAADIIYIPLYFSRNLYLTGIVYIVFLTLCVLGLLTWRRSAYAAEAPA